MGAIQRAIKELMELNASNNKYTDYLLLISRLLSLYDADICMTEELAKSLINSEIELMYME